MQERGLTVRSGGRGVVLHPVYAVADPAEASGDFELVLFTVKGYDTEPAALALRPAVGPHTAVLTLQNGVDSGDRLGAVLGADRVLVGTTVTAATIAEPGIIDQPSPMRRIDLGEPSGRLSPRVESIATALRDAGVDVRVTTDVPRAVWEKFIRLAPGATLTSACQASLGRRLGVPTPAYDVLYAVLKVRAATFRGES